METILQPNMGQASTNPNDASDFIDTDSGGVPDYVEETLLLVAGLTATDKNLAADDANDTDGDGVNNDDEIAQGTNPADATDYPDADGDLVPDNVETTAGTDPNDANSYPDNDSDLVPNYVETIFKPNTGAAATNENDGADFQDTDS